MNCGIKKKIYFHSLLFVLFIIFIFYYCFLFFIHVFHWLINSHGSMYQLDPFLRGSLQFSCKWNEVTSNFFLFPSAKLGWVHFCIRSMIVIWLSEECPSNLVRKAENVVGAIRKKKNEFNIKFFKSIRQEYKLWKFQTLSNKYKEWFSNLYTSWNNNDISKLLKVSLYTSRKS